MANKINPIVDSLTFVGSAAGQATIQSQGNAGGLTFLLPNIPPVLGQLMTVTAVNGTDVFLGWSASQSAILLPISIVAFAAGLGINNQKLIRFKFSYGILFPAGAAASQASASTNATADTTYTFSINGTPFATVLFHAGTTNFTYTQAADQAFSAGDLFELDGPATADATLADIGITFQGHRT
jgi:hypothetical protein